jgi:metal-responsive CopG/Arc/MetJ family transcriptional regulator
MARQTVRIAEDLTAALDTRIVHQESNRSEDILDARPELLDRLAPADICRNG